MILIDKSQAQVEVTVTITENSKLQSPYFLLVLQSLFTTKTHRIQLPANTSEWKNRYDKFILDGSLFNNVEAGNYCYSIFESAIESTDETTMDLPLEMGLARIIEPALEEEFIVITPNEADDDFITYTPD